MTHGRGKVTNLHGGDSDNVVGGRDKSVHAPVAVNFDPCLLDQLHVFLVLFDVCLSREKFASLRRCSRNDGEGCRGYDGADVVAIGILNESMSVRPTPPDIEPTGLAVLSL